MKGGQIMVDTRIVITVLWAALMLIFLLGDVIRIFAGDYVTGELAGKPAAGDVAAHRRDHAHPHRHDGAHPGLAVPGGPLDLHRRRAAVDHFNLAGLPYKGAYDNFLIVVSFAACGLIAWYAWTWPATT